MSKIVSPYTKYDAHHFKMRRQTMILCKILPTYVTNVWSLVRVGRKVQIQFKECDERFFAEITFLLCLFLGISVRS